jgi:rod shape-determining protein MreD
MIDPMTTNRVLFRFVFLAIATVILFIRLLPLQTIPGQWAAPDFLVCIVLAWVLRRPDYVPVLLIAVVVLVVDMVLMRPPGLHAALVILGAEFLRARAASVREMPFALEWASVAAVVLAILIGNRVILLLVLVDRPPPGLSFAQFAATVLAYPVVVAFSRFALGIRNIAPGEADKSGFIR